MRKIFLMMILLSLSAHSQMGVPVSPEDMKKSEKAIREYGIDLKSVKITSAYDIEDLGGLKISMEVLKPVTILGNIIPIGSKIFYKGKEVDSILFEDKSALFKLNKAVCKGDVGLANGNVCRCDIAEDFKFAKGIVISPPAEVSFLNGKPEMFFKKQYSWELNGKTYAPGFYKVSDGKIQKFGVGAGENYAESLCIAGMYQ